MYSCEDGGGSKVEAFMTGHVLHQCANEDSFIARFEEATACSVQFVLNQVVSLAAPKALFLTGSIPLGMATSGSDIDFIALVDGKDAIVSDSKAAVTNTAQRLSFSSESDPLRAGLFMTEMNGVMVELAILLTPAVRRIYERLRSRGPDLSDLEIMMLGRLRSGWLLTQSEDYLKRHGINLADPVLDVYCATRYFSYALMYRKKAIKAHELTDVSQALHLGRLSAEMAYLTYFASEGLPYLGAKWLAQLGHAHGAAERVQRNPLLQKGIPLLFPSHQSDPAEHLQALSQFLTSMRGLIEQKTRFKIAFIACPQIHAL
jgi:hypothetical protein